MWVNVQNVQETCERFKKKKYKSMAFKITNTERLTQTFILKRLDHNLFAQSSYTKSSYVKKRKGRCKFGIELWKETTAT